MPRPLRKTPAGIIYHVMNRGNGGRDLFSREQDFLAFLELLGEALGKFPVDLLGYCLLENQWQLLLRPRTNEALSKLMGWVTVTHTRRHHMQYPKPGTGHLYQGRFKSFPVAADESFLAVARYLHGQPLREGLVKRAEAWRWSDFGAGKTGVKISDWPVARPKGWVKLVNKLAYQETAQVEQSMARGTPFGPLDWQKRIARKLGLESSLRSLGRPKKPRLALHPRYRRALELKAEAEKSN